MALGARFLAPQFPGALRPDAFRIRGYANHASSLRARARAFLGLPCIYAMGGPLPRPLPKGEGGNLLTWVDSLRRSASRPASAHESPGGAPARSGERLRRS